MLAFRSVPGLLIAACLACLFLAAAPPALADTFVVDNDQDVMEMHPGDGVCDTGIVWAKCTLRAAIQEANANPGPDTIQFDPSLPSNTTIKLSIHLGPLVLTDDGTRVDASAQWYEPGGGTAPNPGIYINADDVDYAFELNGADNCTVRSLGIAFANKSGVYIHNGADSNTIGGTKATHPNTFYWNVENGIKVHSSASKGNRIVGNYIGMHPRIEADWLGNGYNGVLVGADGTELEDNYVGNNGTAGIVVDSCRDVVLENNTIGITDSGFDVGNGSYGIRALQTENLVVEGGKVAFNDDHGITFATGAGILAPVPAPSAAADPELTVRDTEVFNNGTGAANGGGIYIESVSEAATVTLSHVDVFSNTAGDGGGVYAEGQDVMLNIEDSLVRGNRAGDGGGVYMKEGDLRIVDSTISSNTAGIMDYNRAGGIMVERGSLFVSRSAVSLNEVGGTAGGIFSLESDTHIADSKISGNSAFMWTGGIHSTKGKLTIVGSTISGNGAEIVAGVKADDCRTRMFNVTVSGNKARDWSGGLALGSGRADLNFLTVTGNVADADKDGTGYAGGIHTYTGSDVHLNNSIVAGNTDWSGQAPDCGGEGVFATHGTNLIQRRTGCSYVVADGSNITNVDPRLGSLADNGGDTRTHALPEDSPAVDAVNNCRTVDDFPASTDQRGRPRPSGDACDIGAYEYQWPIIYLPAVLH